MDSTPIKKEEIQTLINRLSTPRLNKIKSPYQRMIELNYDNININTMPTKTLQKKIENIENIKRHIVENIKNTLINIDNN